MNHSMYSADRTTHLKIVVVGLMSAIVIAGFGISAHLPRGGYLMTTHQTKTTKSDMLTSSSPILYGKVIL